MDLQAEANGNFARHIEQNSYPGRGLVLGRSSDGAGWLQLRDPDGGVGLNIQAEDDYEPPTWPEEPGRQQKMIHLEIEARDGLL